MIIQNGATYRLTRTAKAGRLIELVGSVTRREHHRFGDLRYVCAGYDKHGRLQRRRSGTISAAELERSWMMLLCKHNQSPEVCEVCFPSCPFCGGKCACSGVTK